MFRKGDRVKHQDQGSGTVVYSRTWVPIPFVVPGAKTSNSLITSPASRSKCERKIADPLSLKASLGCPGNPQHTRRIHNGNHSIDFRGDNLCHGDLRINSTNYQKGAEASGRHVFTRLDQDSRSFSYDKKNCNWPGWIRTTTAGSKDRCPAIRPRANVIILSEAQSRVQDFTQIGVTAG